MISVEEARRILALEAARSDVIEVPLREASGMILARPVRADRPIPPFDRAAVDGYAIRLRGPWREGEEFKVLGVLQAGGEYPKSLRPGMAVKVMTGAPVPRGADAVVMVEHSVSIAPDRVRLSGPLEATPAAPMRPGIAPRGQEARKGSLVLCRGARLSPSRIAVLAGVGVVDVPVFRPPGVSILTTGREVIDPRNHPGAAQIRDTNGPLLRSLLCGCGFSIEGQMRLGQDSPQPLRKAIRRAGESEVLLLTGGVSAGDFDFVPGALRAEGYRICFHKVAMRPGKPLLFGVKGTKTNRRVVFGLPGNPVSVLVTAREFVLPYLRAWAGWPIPGPVGLQALAETSIRRRGGVTHFVLGWVRFHTGGRLLVREVPCLGSGDYVSAGRANCLIVLPADDPVVSKGRPASIHLLGGLPEEEQGGPDS